VSLPAVGATRLFRRASEQSGLPALPRHLPAMAYPITLGPLLPFLSLNSQGTLSKFSTPPTKLDMSEATGGGLAGGGLGREDCTQRAVNAGRSAQGRYGNERERRPEGSSKHWRTVVAAAAHPPAVTAWHRRRRFECQLLAGEQRFGPRRRPPRQRHPRRRQPHTRGCDLAAVHRLDRVGGPWDRVGGPSAQAEDIPVDRVA